MYKYLIISIIAFISFSCEEEIDVQTNEAAPAIVIDAHFTSDTTSQVVHLLRTTSMDYDGAPVPVSNAKVIVYDNSDTFEFKESVQKPGWYYSDPNVYGIPGRVYHLKITDVDVNGDNLTETYTAYSVMPRMVPIDSIQVVDTTNIFFEGWMVSAFCQEPEPEGDCYMFDIYRNDTLLTDTFPEKEVQFDYAFNGNYLNGAVVGFLNKERQGDWLRENDTITFKCLSISKDYATFFYEFRQQYYGSNPLFGGPLANISTNIEPKQGAMGFFAVYPVYKVSKVYHKKVKNKN